jgi:hypothetical protein
MPQDQSQLWHLLALLAELKQGGLACCWLHKLRNPIEHAPVLLCHANLGVGLQVVRGTSRHNAITGDGCSIIARDPLVVLLLGLRGGSCGSGSLCLSLRLRCLSLRLELTVLAYMVIGMLVVALRPLARVVLLLLREEVLHLLHLSCGRRVGLGIIVRIGAVDGYK